MPRIPGAALKLITLFGPILVLAALAQAQAQLGSYPVASNLESPDYVTAPPGDQRLFIVERRGVVKIVKAGQVLPTPFMDVDSLVMDLDFSAEAGFWGLTFHPDFPDSPFVFVCYADTANQFIVARYQVSASDPDVVDYSSAKTYLAIPHPFKTHYGGHIAFGSDRNLYVSIGDGGAGGDPGNRAQDGVDLHGKILRLGVLHPPPYTIPPDNPFLSDLEIRDEIWALGLRNPYRWSFDRLSGDLWIGDVGQDRLEEVDYTPASSRGGENYGWVLMEGDSCYRPPQDCWQPGLKLPIFEFNHGEGCAVTGGYVYRGSAVPELFGQYVFGEYCYGRIWTISLPETTVVERTAQLSPEPYSIWGRITGFGEDGFGELYFVILGTGTDGAVYKIFDPSTTGAPRVTDRGAFYLSETAPNPFSSDTRFAVRMNRPGRLDVTVVDVSGRQVARLSSGPQAAGTYSFDWDGKDRGGLAVGPGCYFLRAAVDGRVSTRSLIRIH